MFKAWLRAWLGVEQELAARRSQCEELKNQCEELNRRLANLETKNYAPPELKPKDRNPAGSWNNILHRIESDAGEQRPIIAAI